MTFNPIFKVTAYFELKYLQNGVFWTQSYYYNWIWSPTSEARLWGLSAT